MIMVIHPLPFSLAPTMLITTGILGSRLEPLRGWARQSRDTVDSTHLTVSQVARSQGNLARTIVMISTFDRARRSVKPETA